MVLEEDFYGGAAPEQIDTVFPIWTLTLTSNNPRIRLFDGTISGVIHLPDARTLPVGGPQYYFAYRGSSFIQIQDANGPIIVQLTASGHCAVLSLQDNTTLGGVWAVQKYTQFGTS